MEGGERRDTISVALARLHPAFKALLVVLPAIASAIAGYGKGESVENKAEAGYKVTREDVESIKTKLVELEVKFNSLTAEVATLRRVRLVVSSKKTSSTTPTVQPLPPVASAPPPPAPTPLPADLNQALEKQEAAPEAPK